MAFQPDYRNIVAAARNQRPARLPLYEHIISPEVMERVLDCRFVELRGGDDADLKEFFRQYCRFYQEMTYDTVSFEAGILRAVPDSGALKGGRPGPIQSRKEFNAFPWDEIPERFWAFAGRELDALVEVMPPGMKAIGGLAYGVFEISEDLVGYEYLCYMQADDPELFADIYRRVGELMANLWATFLQRYSKHFAVARFGDDLGFKTATLLAPETIITHVVPQYRRLIALIHQAGLPFLYHSCGRIFEVMEEIIAAGIDAKHSNEDQIAPFEEWISRYGDRIGLFGGIDVDVLCQQTPDEIVRRVLDIGGRARQSAKGYALGSGNSIPQYVPTEGYLAMVRACQELRRREGTE